MNIAMLSGIEILHNQPGFSLLVWSIYVFEADALVYYIYFGIFNC